MKEELKAVSKEWKKSNERLWDHALDLGLKAVVGLQMVSRAMSHHGRGDHPCHLCDDSTLLKCGAGSVCRGGLNLSGERV